MKKIFLISFFLCCISYVYAGFLSYSTIHRNTIMYGSCTFLNPQSRQAEEVANGYITVYIENGNLFFQVSSNKQGYNLDITMPLRYTTIDSERMETSGGIEFTLHSMKYGYIRIGYVNNFGTCSFVVKVGDRLYNIDAIIEFYDQGWNVKERDNGSTIRSGQEVEAWFHGLMIDKRMGLL